MKSPLTVVSVVVSLLVLLVTASNISFVAAAIRSFDATGKRRLIIDGQTTATNVDHGDTVSITGQMRDLHLEINNLVGIETIEIKPAGDTAQNVRIEVRNVDCEPQSATSDSYSCIDMSGTTWNNVSVVVSDCNIEVTSSQWLNTVFMNRIQRISLLYVGGAMSGDSMSSSSNNVISIDDSKLYNSWPDAPAAEELVASNLYLVAIASFASVQNYTDVAVTGTRIIGFGEPQAGGGSAGYVAVRLVEFRDDVSNVKTIDFSMSDVSGSLRTKPTAATTSPELLNFMELLYFHASVKNVSSLSASQCDVMVYLQEATTSSQASLIRASFQVQGTLIPTTTATAGSARQFGVKELIVELCKLTVLNATVTDGAASALMVDVTPLAGSTTQPSQVSFDTMRTIGIELNDVDATLNSRSSNGGPISLCSILNIGSPTRAAANFDLNLEKVDLSHNDARCTIGMSNDTVGKVSLEASIATFLCPVSGTYFLGGHTSSPLAVVVFANSLLFEHEAVVDKNVEISLVKFYSLILAATGSLSVSNSNLAVAKLRTTTASASITISLLSTQQLGLGCAKSALPIVGAPPPQCTMTVENINVTLGSIIMHNVANALPAYITGFYLTGGAVSNFASIRVSSVTFDVRSVVAPGIVVGGVLHATGGFYSVNEIVVRDISSRAPFLRSTGGSLPLYNGMLLTGASSHSIGTILLDNISVEVTLSSASAPPVSGSIARAHVAYINGLFNVSSFTVSRCSISFVASRLGSEGTTLHGPLYLSVVLFAGDTTLVKTFTIADCNSTMATPLQFVTVSSALPSTKMLIASIFLHRSLFTARISMTSVDKFAVSNSRLAVTDVISSDNPGMLEIAAISISATVRALGELSVSQVAVDIPTRVENAAPSQTSSVILVSAVSFLLPVVELKRGIFLSDVTVNVDELKSITLITVTVLHSSQGVAGLVAPYYGTSSSPSSSSQQQQQKTVPSVVSPQLLRDAATLPFTTSLVSDSLLDATLATLIQQQQTVVQLQGCSLTSNRSLTTAQASSNSFSVLALNPYFTNISAVRLHDIMIRVSDSESGNNLFVEGTGCSSLVKSPRTILFWVSKLSQLVTNVTSRNLDVQIAAVCQIGNPEFIDGGEKPGPIDIFVVRDVALNVVRVSSGTAIVVGGVRHVIYAARTTTPTATAVVSIQRMTVSASSLRSTSGFADVRGADFIFNDAIVDTSWAALLLAEMLSVSVTALDVDAVADLSSSPSSSPTTFIGCTVFGPPIEYLRIGASSVSLSSAVFGARFLARTTNLINIGGPMRLFRVGQLDLELRNIAVLSPAPIEVAACYFDSRTVPFGNITLLSIDGVSARIHSGVVAKLHSTSLAGVYLATAVAGGIRNVSRLDIRNIFVNASGVAALLGLTVDGIVIRASPAADFTNSESVTIRDVTLTANTRSERDDVMISCVRFDCGVSDIRGRFDVANLKVVDFNISAGSDAWVSVLNISRTTQRVKTVFVNGIQLLGGVATQHRFGESTAVPIGNVFAKIVDLGIALDPNSNSFPVTLINIDSFTVQNVAVTSPVTLTNVGGNNAAFYVVSCTTGMRNVSNFAISSVSVTGGLFISSTVDGGLASVFVFTAEAGGATGNESLTLAWFNETARSNSNGNSNPSFTVTNVNFASVVIAAQRQAMISAVLLRLASIAHYRTVFVSDYTVSGRDSQLSSSVHLVDITVVSTNGLNNVETLSVTGVSIYGASSSSFSSSSLSPLLMSSTFPSGSTNYAFVQLVMVRVWGSPLRDVGTVTVSNSNIAINCSGTNGGVACPANAMDFSPSQMQNVESIVADGIKMQWTMSGLGGSSQNVAVVNLRSLSGGVNIGRIAISKSTVEIYSLDNNVASLPVVVRGCMLLSGIEARNVARFDISDVAILMTSAPFPSVSASSSSPQPQPQRSDRMPVNILAAQTVFMAGLQNCGSFSITRASVVVKNVFSASQVAASIVVFVGLVRNLTGGLTLQSTTIDVDLRANSHIETTYISAATITAASHLLLIGGAGIRVLDSTVYFDVASTGQLLLAIFVAAGTTSNVTSIELTRSSLVSRNFVSCSGVAGIQCSVFVGRFMDNVTSVSGGITLRDTRISLPNFTATAPVSRAMFLLFIVAKVPSSTTTAAIPVAVCDATSIIVDGVTFVGSAQWFGTAHAVVRILSLAMNPGPNLRLISLSRVSITSGLSLRSTLGAAEFSMLIVIPAAGLSSTTIDAPHLSLNLSDSTVAGLELLSTSTAPNQMIAVGIAIMNVDIKALGTVSVQRVSISCAKMQASPTSTVDPANSTTAPVPAGNTMFFSLLVFQQVAADVAAVILEDAAIFIASSLVVSTSPMQIAVLIAEGGLPRVGFIHATRLRVSIQGQCVSTHELEAAVIVIGGVNTVYGARELLFNSSQIDMTTAAVGTRPSATTTSGVLHSRSSVSIEILRMNELFGVARVDIRDLTMRNVRIVSSTLVPRAFAIRIAVIVPDSFFPSGLVLRNIVVSQTRAEGLAFPQVAGVVLFRVAESMQGVRRGLVNDLNISNIHVDGAARCNVVGVVVNQGDVFPPSVVLHVSNSTVSTFGPIGECVVNSSYPSHVAVLYVGPFLKAGSQVAVDAVSVLAGKTDKASAISKLIAAVVVIEGDPPASSAESSTTTITYINITRSAVRPDLLRSQSGYPYHSAVLRLLRSPASAATTQQQPSQQPSSTVVSFDMIGNKCETTSSATDCDLVLGRVDPSFKFWIKNNVLSNFVNGGSSNSNIKLLETIVSDNKNAEGSSWHIGCNNDWPHTVDRNFLRDYASTTSRVVFDCIPSRSQSHTESKTQLPPPPPPPLKTAEIFKDSSTTIAAMSLMGASPIGAQHARKALAIASMINCPMEEEEIEPLAFDSNPTTLEIGGGDQLSTYRGAIVGNALLLLGCLLVFFVAVLVYKACKKHKTLRKSMKSMQFPGRIAIPVGVFGPATGTAVGPLFLRLSEGTGTFALLLLGVVAYLAVPTAILVWCAYRCRATETIEAVKISDSDDEEGDDDNEGHNREGTGQQRRSRRRSIYDIEALEVELLTREELDDFLQRDEQELINELNSREGNNNSNNNSNNILLQLQQEQERRRAKESPSCLKTNPAVVWFLKTVTPTQQWKESSFVLMWGVFFDTYLDASFAVFEYVLTTLIAAVAGVALMCHTSTCCTSTSVVVVLLAAIHTVVTVAKRSCFITPIDKWLSILISLSTLALSGVVLGAQLNKKIADVAEKLAEMLQALALVFAAKELLALTGPALLRGMRSLTRTIAKYRQKQRVQAQREALAAVNAANSPAGASGGGGVAIVAVKNAQNERRRNEQQQAKSSKQNQRQPGHNKQEERRSGSAVDNNNHNVRSSSTRSAERRSGSTRSNRRNGSHNDDGDDWRRGLRGYEQQQQQNQQEDGDDDLLLMSPASRSRSRRRMDDSPRQQRQSQQPQQRSASGSASAAPAAAARSSSRSKATRT